MSEQKSFGFETRAIHAGAAPDPATGARQTPIYQTTSFVFDDVDDAASLFNLQKVGFIYSRLTNPTVAVLEERLANLEGGAGATATSSGHAAQLLALLEHDLWLHHAQHANDMARLLADRVVDIDGVRLAAPPQVNSVFVHLPPEVIAPLQAWSFFWEWALSQSLVRWMTSFATTAEDVERFARGVEHHLAA